MGITGCSKTTAGQTDTYKLVVISVTYNKGGNSIKVYILTSKQNTLRYLCFVCYYENHERPTSISLIYSNIFQL